jgi:DNA-binding response OmpR family regulator
MSEEPVRILVVDDELGVREGCRKILSAEGFEVTIAEDGQAGLEAFQAHPDFAVLLVDLMMPRLTGLELLRRVRALDEDVVPIIITAHATIDTAVESTKQGAYSFIPKPFTPDELQLAIKNGLERRALAIEARRLREERESRLLEVASERSKSNTIIKCMTDGILVINIERLIVLRNAAAARILPDCASRPVPFPLESLEAGEVKALIAEILDADKEPLIISREVGLHGQRQPGDRTQRGELRRGGGVPRHHRPQEAGNGQVHVRLHGGPRGEEPAGGHGGLAFPDPERHGPARSGRGTQDDPALPDPHPHPAHHGLGAAQSHGHRDRKLHPAPLSGGRLQGGE